jgi:hypothetical protein
MYRVAISALYDGKGSGVTMNIVLKNQIEASEKSAQELENELMQCHRGAILSYNVQDLSRSAVTLFSEINDDVDRWQRDLYNCNHPDSDELAQFGKEWEDLYRRLSNVFDKTFTLIGSLEKAGYPIDGKPEFLASWQELRGIVCFSQTQIAAAIEQKNCGQTRPLGEIERELLGLAND